MAGCLDNIQIERPEWLELGEKRNAVASIVSGTLFFTGWWIIIDVAAHYPGGTDFNYAYHVCGVFGTISLFMINAVSNGQVRGETYTNGFLGQRAARVWLFIGFVLGFGSIIAAVWILFAAYVINGKPPIYPGLALFFQNVLIFAGYVKSNVCLASSNAVFPDRSYSSLAEPKISGTNLSGSSAEFPQKKTAVIL